MPLKILTYPDERLRVVCRPDFIIEGDIIQEMFYLMEEHGGLGLAAPQVGIDARLFVTHWGEVFINPQITQRSCKMLVSEGCLSLPHRQGTLWRYNEVEVTGRVYVGEQAFVIQHECDHLDGKLIISFETIRAGDDIRESYQ